MNSPMAADAKPPDAAPERAGRPNRIQDVRLLLIYGLSGACALVDEVVWARLLKLTLGNTVYASSVVVSTFMAGLALGALIMRSRADRIARPLRAYALLETAVAVSALAFPFLLEAADGIYGWVFRRAEAWPSALLAAQIAVSALLLLVPTSLMGAGLPLLGAFVTARADRSGPLVGRLYAVNTLGAAAGAFLAGFVTIRFAGLLGTLAGAAVLNLVVAASAWLLSRSVERAPRGDAAATAKERDGRAADSAADDSRWRPRLLLAACFLSGAAVLGYEILWVRSLVLILGGFTYVFSAVLTVYLTGHMLGAWLGSRMSGAAARPAVLLGAGLIALGACGIGWIPLSQYWVRHVVQPAMADPLGHWTCLGLGRAGQPILHASVFVLLPSFLSGFVFPLALQAWGRFREKVGENTGLVYGINTLGAVCGGMVTGFLLVPLAGVQGSGILLGLAVVWCGASVVMAFGRPAEGAAVLRRARRWAAPASAGVLSLAAAAIPSDLFLKTFTSDFGGTFLDVKEGIHATVAAIRMPDGSRVMSIDNMPMVGDGAHRSAQQTLGHLAALLHPDPRSVLSVGFGGGETTACLARHRFERLDCVEVVPEVVDLARRHFSHINGGPEMERKVRLIFMDAKQYLKFTGRTYDLILNDSDVHATSGSAPLFSRDHFLRARARLNAGGLFMTKLHLQGDPRSNLDCILRTFLSVFPHVTVWFPVTKPYLFVYLVGSDREQRFSPGGIERRLADPSVRESLAPLHVRRAADLLGFYLGDRAGLERWAPPGALQGDWAPYLEFNPDPRILRLRDFFPALAGALRRDTLEAALDFTDLAGLDEGEWRKEMARFQRAAECLLQAHGAPLFPDALRHAHEACRIFPAHPAFESARSGYLQEIQRGLSQGLLDAGRLRIETAQALDREPGFAAAWLVECWLWALQGDAEKAMSAAAKAVNLEPEFADAHAALGTLYLKSGRAQEGLFHHREAARLKTRWENR